VSPDPAGLLSATEAKPQISPKAIASIVLTAVCVAILIVNRNAAGTSVGTAIHLAGVTVTGLLLAIAAIVFGHVARSQIRRRSAELHGKKIALIGLILAYPVFLIFALMSAFSIHDILTFRVRENETFAMDYMHSISEGVQFLQANPPDREFEQKLNLTHGDYCNLRDLEKVGGGLTVSGAGDSHGYHFTLTCTDRKNLSAGVRVVATPTIPGQTGDRGFCFDSSGGLFDIQASPSGQPQCASNAVTVRP
jgi:Domain of unknown function (DUF4190)